jgi:hypothetical protein
MSKEKNSRKETNWESQLNDDEVMQADNKKVVLLKGLQRLANLAGLVSSDCEFLYIPVGKIGIVQCIYRTVFDDGTKWVGSADVNALNTDEFFIRYPTAVAESRAEARCLRKALGIRMLAAEEIDINSGMHSDVQPKQKIADSVVRAIQQLCDTKSIEPIEVINAIINDEQRANSIFEFSQLNAEEGQKAMAFLNEARVKKSSDRDERKKQLLDKKSKG